MRLFETLLLVTNIAVFLVLVTSVPPTIRGVQFMAPILLFIAIIHITFEGGRWQMVPAYAVTGILLLFWLLQSMQLAGRNIDFSQQSRLAIGLGFLGLALTFLLPLLFPVFQMPRPSGPYDIGTLTFYWKDEDRSEIYTKDPSDVRELMVQIWYPAQEDNHSHYTAYLEDTNVLIPLAHLLNLPEFVFGHLKYITTNSREAAPIANENDSYPVLIFSHGRGGFRQHNTVQIEELVSKGYIVVSIDHTYAASGVVFPDGRLVSMDPRMLDRTFIDNLIPYLAQDVIFTINHLNALNQLDPNGILTGRLDLHHAGIFGLSMGGQIAAEACLMDLRLKACLIMDVGMPPDVVEEGLLQPTMWISRDKETMKLEGWSVEDINDTHSTIRAVFQKSRANGYFVQVPGMFHPNFSDAPLFTPLASWFGLAGSINKRLAHEIVSAYSLAFFEHHLRAKTERLLEPGTETTNDVLFEAR